MLKRITRRAALLLALAWPAAGLAETVEYIHTDALGSPVAITDAAGNVIERTVYEPYGGMVNKAAVDGPGFTGHVADSATGLSYMQQRYYDPETGVFYGVDPVTALSDPLAQFNRYRYANSSPYKFFDPDGRVGCTGTRIQSVCDQGGIAGLQTSARSFASVLGQRAKTPSSQARLIESVGGNAATLEEARETHEGFVTAAIGVIAGGGLGGNTAARGTTTLYRAVSEAEAASIGATGRFTAGPNSLGGKWFAETLENAKRWGDLLNGKGTSKLLEVKLPKSAGDQLMRMERLDGIGPARYGELNQLEQAVIRELP